MNQTLENYKEILPNIKNYFNQDIMIGLTDGEKFVGFWPGTKMTAPINIGDRLKPNDPMIESFHTGRTIDVTLPPDIHGFPFRSITSAVRDKNNKIVGTIGIGISLETLYSVENIINNINENLDKTLEKINLFNNSSIEVSEKSKNILKVMDTIVEISNKINSTTKKINEISMQTQILAINASIEAARAGLSGKGFSVVAQEMKKLSITSEKSSQGIFDLIAELLKQVEENYSELKNLEETINEQNQYAQVILDNINSSKSLSNSVIDTIHK